MEGFFPSDTQGGSIFIARMITKKTTISKASRCWKVKSKSPPTATVQYSDDKMLGVIYVQNMMGTKGHQANEPSKHKKLFCRSFSLFFHQTFFSHQRHFASSSSTSIPISLIVMLRIIFQPTSSSCMQCKARLRILSAPSLNAIASAELWSPVQYYWHGRCSHNFLPCEMLSECNTLA